MHSCSAARVYSSNYSVLKGDELTNKVLKLIQVLFPDYAENLEKIELNRVSGALTKYVCGCVGVWVWVWV